MDGAGLRRRDTTKGTPLRILSLDGGGVRGYSMLILLHDFMHKVHTECHNGVPPEADRVPKPCEYFDLIAGTGTGGLIAIMLGRLRMNTKDCMRIYVQMTRKVFETDKTIAGIPYRSTLFKASMLEEAIRACVKSFEHEKDADEAEERDMLMSPTSYSRPQSIMSDQNGMPRSSTNSTRYSLFSPNAYTALGNPNAPLEDPRKEKRTKTAVTAVLKGHTERSGTSVLLRSYPSRTQPAVESDCTIWQAGRATCATKLAFKEIRIGTSTFLDEGYGLVNSDKTPTYNPAPQILDEAIINEWPGQSVGLFLSVGTGRRPAGTQNRQSEWWEGFAGGLGSFAEAKRRLIAKIEGCEKTHKEMLSIHLPKRGVNPDHYLRLNVEVGVGEFGMNEWNRLADISNSTQSYLNTPAVKVMLNNGAREMAKVEAMRRELAAKVRRANENYEKHHPPYQPPTDPYAVELPSGDVTPLMPRPLSRPGPQYPVARPLTFPQGPAPSLDDKYLVVTSDEYPQPTLEQKTSDEKPYRHSSEHDRQGSQEAPPLPPKTPVTFNDGHGAGRHHPNVGTPPPHRHVPTPLPYPDDDGPPPAVNLARKPEFVTR
ncbi:MAG: hypothetical protein Q9163_000006 [Psora crenata]